MTGAQAAISKVWCLLGVARVVSLPDTHELAPSPAGDSGPQLYTVHLLFLTPQVLSHSRKTSPSKTSPTLPVTPDGREGPFNFWSLRGVMVSHSCFFSEEKAKHVEMERNPSSSLVEAILA